MVGHRYRAERQAAQNRHYGNELSRVPSSLKRDRAFEAASMGEVHNQAEELIEGVRLLMEDYEHIVGPEQIAKHQAELDRLKALPNWNEDSVTSRFARISEAIMHDVVMRANWLGEGARAYIATEYDDYKRGVDLIFEITDPESRYVGAGVDVTYSRDTLLEKARKVKASIDRGTLSSVEYFQPDDGSDASEIGLKDIPRFQIHLDKDTVINLARHWHHGEYNVLAQHEVQLLVLKDAIEQFEMYGSYARETGKDSIAETYEKAQKAFEAILAEREKAGVLVSEEREETRQKDGVVTMLRRSQIFKIEQEEDARSAEQRQRSGIATRLGDYRPRDVAKERPPTQSGSDQAAA